MSFAPTTEQLAALDAFATGEDLIIEAGAGTGKTSTLQLLAESDATRRGQYIAFNRAIVKEAQGRMPRHVSASTAHSLAFRALGNRYAHRLKGWRMRSDEVAVRLRIEPISLRVGDHQKTLAAGYLAGLVMRAITQFCQSADAAPGPDHVPYVEGIDMMTDDGKRGWDNNNLVRQALQPFMDAAWADLQRTDGQLNFKHEHYLKMWERSAPFVGADVIFFDEAQDVSPVLASIVAQQTHAQRVYVGDSNQAIYQWLGAVDALAQLRAGGGARVATLTQSFRFGDAVADVANRVLATLPTDMRLSGTPTITSSVAPVATPDAILCRSNACAVQTLMDEASAGRRAHLVGGGDEVAAFAKAAQELQTYGRTQHQDLACFLSWGQVQEYVRQDAQGDELKLLVDLVDRFSAPAILQALEAMPEEDDADLVISTAHKAKGRQWASVQLAGDFPDDPASTSDDERRLLYVAVTRARIELDAGSVPWLVDGQAGAPLIEPAAAKDPEDDYFSTLADIDTTIRRDAGGHPMLTALQAAALARLSLPEHRHEADGMAMLAALWGAEPPIDATVALARWIIRVAPDAAATDEHLTLAKGA